MIDWSNVTDHGDILDIAADWLTEAGLRLVVDTDNAHRYQVWITQHRRDGWAMYTAYNGDASTARGYIEAGYRTAEDAVGRLLGTRAGAR